MLVEAFDDGEDYSKGLTEYLSLMSAGLQKVVGGGHGLKTIHMKSMVEPEVDPQFRKRKNLYTPEGEAVLKSLDLQVLLFPHMLKYLSIFEFLVIIM